MYAKDRAVNCMDIVRELEAMRKRMLQEINTEFDVLLSRIAEETGQGNLCASLPVNDATYPLTAGAGIFKGKKPTGVVIGGEYVPLRTWKQLVAEIMARCMADARYEQALQAQAGRVSGKKRALLASPDEGMRSPLPIGGGLFLETHYDTETLLNILMNRILRPIGYDYSAIRVTVREV